MTKRKTIFAAALILTVSCLGGCGNYREIGRSSYRSSSEKNLASATERTVDEVPEITAGIVTEVMEEPEETDVRNFQKAEGKPEETNVSNPPETYIISDVPHFFQKGSYPTGCESVSAVSLMNYYGIDITVDEFIDNFLPCSELPYLGEDGSKYGESPWFSFIGDPRSANGYGCYAPVIENAVAEALPEEYVVEAEYGTTLEYAAEEYVANGEPVMIWATIGMKKAWEGNSWTVPNGEYFTFISPEHALLLIGYDEECYYFSDPLSESEVVSYPKYDCEQAYSDLGAQMIRIKMCE